MAAPGHRFRTHDGRAFLGRQVQQSREGGAKFVGGHVISVTAKGSVAPAEIDRIFFRVAEAAETFHVQVLDSLLVHGSGKHRASELRNAPRFGNGTDINEPLNAMSRERGEKFLARSCGMPDGGHGYVRRDALAPNV